MSSITRQWYKVVDHGKDIRRYLKMTRKEAEELGQYRNLTVTQEVPPNQQPGNIRVPRLA